MLIKESTHLIADPEKRTAKVRAAAVHPRIKIVKAAWLFDSVNQWRALDEGPYIIPTEADKQDNGLLEYADAANVEELLEFALSAAEDDEKPDTEVSEPPAIDPEAHVAEEMLDSAVAELTHEDWEGMRAEFEGLSSDSEDEGVSTDGDSETSNLSQESKQSKQSRQDTKKRKRPDSRGVSTDDEDGEASTTITANGSPLQRRKRKALERTTSLHAVTTLAGKIDLEAKRPGGASGEVVDEMLKSDGAKPEESGDELDVDLEAEFEKELMAQDQKGQL